MNREYFRQGSAADYLDYYRRQAGLTSTSNARPQPAKNPPAKKAPAKKPAAKKPKQPKTIRNPNTNF